ncbi:hypothetical protein KSF_072390 [Reticulibacter mediterranei]|uniref:SnoaL-like domain-containing protein n=1 Tax=Reticulibacter mediterranei TaxID=2778369 RepID=A0A8J3IXR6_9CHLR|nr:nuclear transport factor 2 family protein [Reticulibacter mediterranei]GHO97191.1 hypothetical protein KSF_072390 [Reticulibacter mediterranei]
MLATTALAYKVLRAWETNDTDTLAACLSQNFVGRKLLPQEIDKDQFLDYTRAILRAFPDWSFQARFLNEHPVRSYDTAVQFITQIAATHSGDLALPEIPVIPPTGTKITLPAHHLDLVIHEGIIREMGSDFSPDSLTEILAQLGMELL